MTGKIRHRRLVATAIIAGALLILVVLILTKPRAERLQPVAPVPMVTTHTVAAEPAPITVTGWGTVEPKRSIDLIPQVGGRVASVSEKLLAGAFFKQGEVLLRIEDTDYVLAVHQARSQVAQAEFALATAQEEARVATAEWDRTRDDALAGSSLGDAEPNQLVFREPQLRQAEVGLEAAKAALSQAELNLFRCSLTAPFDGRVLNESVDLGQVVGAGQVLGRIYDIAVAQVTVNLADQDLAWISIPLSPDDESAGSLAVIHGQFAGREHQWQGIAVRIAGAVDRASRQVPVVVEIPDPYATEGDRPPLLSGLFVGVTFRSPIPVDAVTIPRRGLRPGDQVWVLDQDNKLGIRSVQVARAGVETAVITAGLAPGDRLVTSNLQYVVEGMQLRGRELTEQISTSGGQTP